MYKGVRRVEWSGVFSPVSTENWARDRREQENTKKGSVQEITSELL